VVRNIFLSTLILGLAAGPATASPRVAQTDAPGLVRLGLACRKGSVAARIGGARVCLHVGSKCRARYERTYKKKGFHCANGRLQKLPAPQPPIFEPPEALPGDYQITTSQCDLGVCDLGGLTVAPGSMYFKNLDLPFTAQCTPPNTYTSILITTQDSPIPIDYPELTFQLSGTFPISDTSGTIGTGSATVNGKFDATGNVSGTFDDHASVDNAGTHYECDTGNVSFSGKLQGSSS